MSTENVELVKAFMPNEIDLVAVVASEDPIAIFVAEPTGVVDPDIEVIFEAASAGGPDVTFRGLDGMIEGWRDWLMPWQSYRITIEDFLDAGEHVIVPVRVVGRTERHGVEMEHDQARCVDVQRRQGDPGAFLPRAVRCVQGGRDRLMRIRALAILCLLIGLVLVVAPAPAQQRDPKVIKSIELDVTINPASAEWVKEALDDAKRQHAYMVIFRLDTPGGLDDSMRKIIKRIIAAPMPVVVYVYPNGARAASAGLYITEAADVAAMAPQTNIGSATPISLGGGNQDKVLGRKVRNDAAAFVRALAEGHGRNPDLAEQMVRKATNVPAPVAKQRNLVDVIAPDVPSLVRQLDGYRVKGPKAQRLETSGARIEARSLPFKFQLLELLVNPNTVFLLFTLGLIGLGFELFHPGAILPGTIGGISLIIALFGLAQLPINIAGLLLILLAFGLFGAEAFLTSHGALAIGGVISLTFGGLLLFNTNNSAYEISVPVVIFTAALLGSFFVFIISKAVQARHRTVHTGSEEMIGAQGTVRARLDPVGHVFVKGALWRAHTPDDRPLEVGEEVRVQSIDGLTLTVTPLVREPEPQRVE